MTKIRGVDIHWHGHDSFRVEADGKVIYVDPWQLGDAPRSGPDPRHPRPQRPLLT